MISRIAPTPSGFLHEGNLANFLLISRLVGSADDQLFLRIDDIDPTRRRPEYLDDIFAALEWLDIQPDRGPGSVAEFLRDFSLPARLPDYRATVHNLVASSSAVFACSCTRSQIRRTGSSGYSGTCRARQLSWNPGETALRLRVADGPVTVAGRTVEHDGDPIIWRRDDLPAYHLMSVVDDSAARVTHIIRGADLVGSSWLQQQLAAAIGESVPLRATYLHHPLLSDTEGDKLSKSAGRQGSSIVGSPTTYERVHRLADELSEGLWSSTAPWPTPDPDPRPPA